MSQKYRVGTIGCGKPRGTQGATGYGMSHQHWIGFEKTGKCELAAVADISDENARAFVKDHNPSAAIYSDYLEMMGKEKIDIVSVSLWPHLHSKVVCDLVRFKPKAILCEKPMDSHWDASAKMHEACKEAGILLAINHQRRFNKPFSKMKSLLDEGAIGKLLRLEAAWHNFQDSGTHWMDMLFYFNNDTAAEWVLGQIDLRNSHKVFGALQEGHGVITFRFKDGVRATFFAGLNHPDLGCMIRAIGTDGILEIADKGPGWLRMHQYLKPGWQNVDTEGEGIHDNAAIYRGVADLVSCVESGKTPLLSSVNAIKPEEVIFAAYESSLRRARVDLPLAPGPSALLKIAELTGQT